MKTDRNNSRRRGFSFTEIMFAVVIMGIGFIMVAAVFPVAIQQSKMTTEEITATVISRAATAYLERVAVDGANPTTANFPATGENGQKTLTSVSQVLVTGPSSVPQYTWNVIRGNMILSDDPRYGWEMLYRRDGDKVATSTADWAPYAQVYIFPVQVRNKTIFTADDTMLPTSGQKEANLMPHSVRVAIAPDITGVTSLVAFDRSAPQAQKDNIEAAVEGAYIVIADDRIASPNGDKGRMNGRMYKLGARREDLDNDTTVFPNVTTSTVYELAPDGDFRADAGADGVFADPTNMSDPHRADDILGIGIDAKDVSGDSANTQTVSGTADAFIIGRGYADPANPGNPPVYEGDSMAISAFTTFIKVR